MKRRYFPKPEHLDLMTNEEMFETFAVAELFQPGKIILTYSDMDRAVVGGACPAADPLLMPAPGALRAEYFCERRELGVINIGGNGKVKASGQNYEMNKLDALYLGRGSNEVSFSSVDPDNPAKFYLLSYPAHTSYPAKLVKNSEANKLELGSLENSNERIIYQYIRPGIVDSCQLVMGLTILSPGSVWNTMPPHRHERRTEIYLYFDIPEGHRVFHLMGEPSNTKHIVIENETVMLSPTWSIHSGAGTHAYSFIWGMGGENLDYTDMDFVTIDELS